MSFFVGLMYVWGVSLNSISMINLVMAIGFAVDYSAHFAHSFVFSTEKNPEEKVIAALRTVGASVLLGGKLFHHPVHQTAKNFLTKNSCSEHRCCQNQYLRRS